LSKENNRDVQHVIDNQRYANLFSQTSLYGKNVRSFTEGTFYRNSTLFQVVGHKGRYLATGVGGGITGRGFTHGIIDDPIKNRQEAESEAVRKTVYDWYTSTFYTRRESDNAPILIILTRWHEDDLAGRLLKAMKQGDENADQWDVIDLQAIATEEKPKNDKREVGEALWPNKFDKTALAKIKTNVGSYDWSSLYQQRPQPPGGSKIKRFWFKIAKTAPDRLWWVRFWDLAFSKKKGSSYTASGLGAYDKDNNLYIKDVVRIRAEWPDVKKEILRLAQLEGVKVGVEQVGPMKGFIDELTREEAFKRDVVVGYAPEGNKLARALRWTPKAEAGKVVLIEGHWNNPFLDEVEAFTGADGEANDQVDMVSGLHQMLGDGEQQSLTVDKDHREGLIFGGIMDEVF
jgi:predicted phage terminase large subunit-like protein